MNSFGIEWARRTISQLVFLNQRLPSPPAPHPDQTQLFSLFSFLFSFSVGFYHIWVSTEVLNFLLSRKVIPRTPQDSIISLPIVSFQHTQCVEKKSHLLVLTSYLPIFSPQCSFLSLGSQKKTSNTDGNYKFTVYTFFNVPFFIISRI